MFKRFFISAVFALLSTGSLTAVFGQTTGSIAGAVVDQSGAAVPNATVTVKGQAGQDFTAVTGDQGAYTVPAVASGVYTVTVSAPGFKSFVAREVKVDVGLPSTVNVSLEVGEVSQTVEVVSGAEVLQTQTATVGTTITGRQITDLPLTSRDALDLVTLLPGTAQVGRPRQSTINGLPKGSLSITTDGVDVQDNLLKSSDGFFTFIRPRLDSIEEVTVSTNNPGAESSGDGAVQIKFVTRRGTNEYRGGLFWQHRDQSLNSNYWFNNLNGLPRNPINLNQYGGRIGGPIPYPNFGDGGGPLFKSGKDRAFFFFSREEFRIPESINRTRTILAPQAASGIFRYGTTQVNLLQLAAANGFTSTVDPTVAGLLSAIQGSASQGTITPTANPNQQFLNYIALGGQKRFFTTLRTDFNITKNHSLENVYNRQIFRNGVDFLNNADPSFPGFPNFGGQDSDRFSNTTALRSTLASNIVNEFRYSVLWGASAFRGTLSPDRQHRKLQLRRPRDHQRHRRRARRQQRLQPLRCVQRFPRFTDQRLHRQPDLDRGRPQPDLRRPVQADQAARFVDRADDRPDRVLRRRPVGPGEFAVHDRQLPRCQHDAAQRGPCALFRSDRAALGRAERRLSSGGRHLRPARDAGDGLQTERVRPLRPGLVEDPPEPDSLVRPPLAAAAVDPNGDQQSRRDQNVRRPFRRIG